MGIYKYLRKSWKKPEALYRPRTAAWRKGDAVERLERPTRIARARSLGYRAKQGFAVARSRIRKGGRKRPKIRKGRKPRSAGRFFTTKQSKQVIAEKRAARKFMNMEVLNSYYAGEDGKYKYYEVILVDPHHPAIKSDAKISWVLGQRKRAFRGLTSASKKSRGI